MKTQVRKISVRLTATLLVVAILGSVCLLWAWNQNRQYLLDRQLIGAMEVGDIERAIALVDVGADPNTEIYPPRALSLFEVVESLLHPSLLAEPIFHKETAFQLACGGVWDHDGFTLIECTYLLLFADEDAYV